ncbi:MAG: hypothetical protein ACRC7R_06390, partial [Sarcina sp.]
LIILSLTLFLTIYLFAYGKTNKDFKNAKKVSKEISLLNSNLNNALEENHINVDKSLDALSKNKNSLEHIKDSILKTETSKKYEPIFKNLTLAIDSNLKLYDHSILLLKNLKSNDINEGLENLNSFISETNKAYELCKKDGLDASLTKDGQAFYDSFNFYVNELVKINRDSTIASSQKSEFALCLEKYIHELSLINKDLMPSIETIRNEKRDLSIMIDDINKKLDSLMELKNDFYSISIPSDLETYFDDFNSLIDKSFIYLYSLKDALKEEASFGKINYDKVLSDYVDLTTSFEKFKSNFDKFANNK